MNTKAKETLSTIFTDWQNEEEQLEVFIDAVRDWMGEVGQLGIPHFGEAATRLRPLRQRLDIHFEREDSIVQQLGALYESGSPEIDAVRRQSIRDHQKLLDFLDDFIRRLDETDPHFKSWEQAMEQLEMFVSLLEQHEDQESDSIQTLIRTPQ